LSLATLAPAGIRCELIGAKACIDYASLESPNIILPRNTTRIAKDPFSVCLPAIIQKEAVDIVFAVDQSLSMAEGPAPNDPNFYTPQAVKNAIYVLQEQSPNSNVGFLGFSAGICENTLVPLAPLSTNLMLIDQQTNYGPGNYSFDCGRLGSGTDYVDALTTAETWLKASTSGNRKIIIFLTDGQPSSLFLNDLYTFMSGPPQKDSTNFPALYPMFLGQMMSPDLILMAKRTGGRDTLIDDPANIGNILVDIIEENMFVELTGSLILNTTNQASSNADMANHTKIDANSYDIVFDREVALVSGTNTVTFTTTSTAAPQTKNVTMNVSGDSISTVTTIPIDSVFSIQCVEESYLTATDVIFTPIQQLSFLETSFRVMLTIPSDLENVNITATGSNGESEGIAISGQNTFQTGATFSYTTGTPVAGNQVFEGDIGTVFTFTWTHPSDPRDYATASLLIIDGSNGIEPGGLTDNVKYWPRIKYNGRRYILFRSGNDEWNTVKGQRLPVKDSGKE
jgi:hypothetical protein